MRVLPPHDPLGDAAGALPRAHVLEVLHRHGVAIIPEDGGTLLEHGEEFWWGDLPVLVGGLTIKNIARELGLDPLIFYESTKHLQH